MPLKSLLHKLLIVVAVLALMPLLARAASIEELRAQIAAKEQQVQRLEAEADAYRKSISETLAKANTLKNEINRITSQIQQLDYNLKITSKKIEATQLKITELGLKIEETNQNIRQKFVEVGETLRTISEFDSESLLATLFKSRRLSEFFNQESYLEGLQLELRNQVASLKQLRADLSNDLNQSEAAKRELQALSLTLKNQKYIASDKQQEKKTLLAETKNQEQNYQRLLSETTKKQEAIEREIFDLESELRRQISFANLPARAPGLFVMPLDNAYVTQEFGPTAYDGITKDFYQFHNGIDFGSKTGVGTPIKAALDGRVSATGNDGRYAYGKWVTIKHANGLTTLYAHLSLVGVNAGAAVTRGQIIGYMGSTGLATGPHLHFTVYATDTFRVENRWFGPLPLGGAINPRDYLPPF